MISSRVKNTQFYNLDSLSARNNFRDISNTFDPRHWSLFSPPRYRSSLKKYLLNIFNCSANPRKFVKTGVWRLSDVFLVRAGEGLFSGSASFILIKSFHTLARRKIGHRICLNSFLENCKLDFVLFLLCTEIHIEQKFIIFH